MCRWTRKRKRRQEVGREEGIKEGKKLIEASLLRGGLTTSTISKATGLKEEETLVINND